jgi:hypothetical protein
MDEGGGYDHRCETLNDRGYAQIASDSVLGEYPHFDYFLFTVHCLSAYLERLYVLELERRESSKYVLA